MEFNYWNRVNYNYNGWSMGLAENVFFRPFLKCKILRETENENVINFYRANGEMQIESKSTSNVPVTHLQLVTMKIKRYAFKMNMFQFGLLIKLWLTNVNPR